MFHSLLQLMQLVVLGLALLLPLANPLTSMSLLLSLGDHLSRAQRREQIRQGTWYVIGIMVVTYYAGAWIMNTFGISIPGVRIAGGLIVAFIGFSMLFPKTPVEEIPEASKTSSAIDRSEAPNIAFVPLAMPGTAGPGTIAMIISATSKVVAMQDQYPHWMLIVVPPLVFIILGIIFWLCLSSAERVVKFIGHAGVEAFSRVMGFLLVCMGVQFVINGILAIVYPDAAS